MDVLHAGLYPGLFLTSYATWALNTVIDCDGQIDYYRTTDLSHSVRLLILFFITPNGNTYISYTMNSRIKRNTN